MAAQSATFDGSDPMRLAVGLREVNYLIKNWETKTTYCNFGEFKNELLTPQNKEELLKAASKNAFWDYDKSDTMNVKCKRDPQVVRALVGLTDDNLNLKNVSKYRRMIAVHKDSPRVSRVTAIYRPLSEKCKPPTRLTINSCAS